MSINSAWIEHQRKRWLRPDWKRWMREDAHRFLPPGEQAALRRARSVSASRDRAHADESSSEAEQRALNDTLLEIRRELAEVKFELAWRSFCRKYGYNPDQPRVPAGNPDGGQWTGGEASGSADAADDGEVRVAAMSWKDKVEMLFGQRELFEGALPARGGSRGTGTNASGADAPILPPFKGEATSGILRIPGKPDTELVSGYGGPASSMPRGASGYDLMTIGHVEGHAAAIMQNENLMQGTLYLNNPAICLSCVRNLPSMLPAGSRLDVIDGRGVLRTFIGAKP
jgi:hypothetical protein